MTVMGKWVFAVTVQVSRCMTVRPCTSYITLLDLPSLLSTITRNMLASKTFVKKTKKGAVVKVVREHYLRDDVWCGVRGCGMCRQQDPPLENCPLVDSDLCPDPHYLVPDTNIVLHQIDFLADPAITNVIILQVVLQEVSGTNFPGRVCPSVRFHTASDQNWNGNHLETLLPPSVFLCLYAGKAPEPWGVQASPRSHQQPLQAILSLQMSTIEIPSLRGSEVSRQMIEMTNLFDSREVVYSTLISKLEDCQRCLADKWQGE